MIKFRFLPLILLFVSAGFPCNGQSFQKTDFGVKTTANGINIEVRFYGPSTARIVKWPENNSFKKESLSVVKKPEGI